MSLTLKVAHICNHSVLTTTEKKDTVTFIKSDSSTDIFSDTTISEVDYIIDDNDFLLFPKQHFNIVGSNKIEWVMDENERPISGSPLTMIFYSTKTVSKSYDSADCVRCGGNGWYTSTASASDVSIDLATGIDKLLQDFLKILLTDSRHYVMGTSLKAIIGEITRTDTDIKTAIVRAVREAETLLKRIQYEMLLEQKEVPSEELLKSVIIDEIEQMDPGEGYYVLLSLVNESSYALSIGLNL